MTLLLILIIDLIFYKLTQPVMSVTNVYNICFIIPKVKHKTKLIRSYRSLCWLRWVSGVCICILKEMRFLFEVKSSE